MNCRLSAVVLAAAVLCTPIGPRAGHGQPPRHNRIVDLLSQRKVVLGWFATARTPGAATRAATDPLMDFVFINMEQVASYKPGEVKAFLSAMVDAGMAKNPNVHPVMARLPIFHDDPAAARVRIGEMLDLGVHAIVFPDMETADEARDAIAAMRYARGAGSKDAGPAGTRPDRVGDAPAFWGLSPEEYRRKADVYPINPDGELAAIFIIESEKGIANSRDITRVRPSVAIPGPGTLRRVYQGDMARVEQAIQTQLASCKEFDVPCGITANAGDVEKRIREGFRLIIVYDRDYAETMAVARRAAGRG
jgi:4-hydroxy-2-oxoheptanedioate aldolase